MQDDTWSHTLEAPKTRVYHTALRSLSLGPFGKTLSTGWLQPGTELRYCVHIVSSCDHPEAWGYQPLWRLHGYPVTMLLESWNDFLHQEEPQQGSRPKLGQSSGVCLTVSTSVQPQKGYSISTRDWFYKPPFSQLTGHRGASKTSETKQMLGESTNRIFSSKLQTTLQNKSQMHPVVKSCYSPTSQLAWQPSTITSNAHAKPRATEGINPHEQHTWSKNRHCHNRVKARSIICPTFTVEWWEGLGGTGAGREGEKRPSDHNHISTITVIKTKKPQRT